MSFPFGEVILVSIDLNEIQVITQPESGDAIDLSFNRIVNTGISHCVE